MEFMTLLSFAISLYAAKKREPSGMTEQLFLRNLEGYMEKWDVDPS